MSSVNKRNKSWKSWRDLKYQILERDNFDCFYCGIKVNVFKAAEEADNTCAHIDHLLPQCQGGSDAASNLVTACRSCNCTKGKKSLEEYRRYVDLRDHEYIRAQYFLRQILDECDDLPFRKQLKAMLVWLENRYKPSLFPGEIDRMYPENRKKNNKTSEEWLK